MAPQTSLTADPVRQHELLLARVTDQLTTAGWTTALAALRFAQGYHTGTRKDGVTPEFSHQVTIAAHLLTLTAHLTYPEDTVAVAFLHDTAEDYDVELSLISIIFGHRIGSAVTALTKEHHGIRRDPAEVAHAQAADEIASVVKGADRVHNHSTIGVFSPTKMIEYITETADHIVPMVETARTHFPDQADAYDNLLIVLTSQMDIIRQFAHHRTATTDAA